MSSGADVTGLTGVVVFLPCRAGSTRVPEKNTRPFAGHGGGLLGVKLDQLERLAQELTQWLTTTAGRFGAA